MIFCKHNDSFLCEQTRTLLTLLSAMLPRIAFVHALMIMNYKLPTTCTTMNSLVWEFAARGRSYLCYYCFLPRDAL